MPLTSPKDTLAYHRDRLLSQHRDWGDVPCSAVAERIRDFMAKDQDSDTVPEREAFWFYLLNHGMAEIQKAKAPYEPLGDYAEFVEGYYDKLTPRAIRAFYYLLLICTRESRHMHQMQPSWWENVANTFGNGAVTFASSLKGTNSTTAYQKFLSYPPQMALGPYCKSLVHIFYKGGFGHSFGGKAWGGIADCLSRFVSGEYSGEMMLDTVWTLCHNNGPIFNKGMMYACYDHSLVLTRILDVQRAGQIPELVLTPNDPKTTKYVTHEQRDIAHWIKKKFPDAVGDYVDWYAVEALGSKGKYPTEKALQAQVNGAPPATGTDTEGQPTFVPKPKAKPGVPVKPAVVPTKETHFEVQPGVLVEKYKPLRKKAA